MEFPKTGAYIAINRRFLDDDVLPIITIIFEPDASFSAIPILDYFPFNIGLNLIIPKSAFQQCLRVITKARRDNSVQILAYDDKLRFKGMGFVYSSAIEIAKSIGAKKLLLLNSNLQFYKRDKHYFAIENISDVVDKLFTNIANENQYRQAGLVAREDSSALLHTEEKIDNVRLNRFFCLDIDWLEEKDISIDTDLPGNWDEDLTLQILTAGGKNFSIYSYAQGIDKKNNAKEGLKSKFLKDKLAKVNPAALALNKKWPNFTKLRYSSNGNKVGITIFWKRAAALGVAAAPRLLSGDKKQPYS